MNVLVTGGSGFIGTSVVDHLIRARQSVANVDIRPPMNPSQRGYFKSCDLQDLHQTRRLFQEFQPQAVIHLAARTDVVERGTVESEYGGNIRSTQNLLALAGETPSVQRLIVTSTQYVCRPGHTPKGPEDFNPHTLYGESKVRTEQLTRAAGLGCVWTIIRPVTIWGPWHLRYRDTLFQMMGRGLYVHPSGHACVQGFGYVRNMALQLEQLLTLEREQVDRRVLYIGDGHHRLVDWVNAFSLELCGREVRTVPRSLLYLASRFGDLVEAVTGHRLPLYSARYRNMTEDYIVPLAPTLALLGPPRFTLSEGVRQTVDWLATHPG